jgi:hypothetical protein
MRCAGFAVSSELAASPPHLSVQPWGGHLTLSIINGRHQTLAVIKTFADQSTKDFWDTGKSQTMPPANLRKASRKKLAMLHAATRDLMICEFLPAIGWKSCAQTVKASTLSLSTSSSACASCGGMTMPTT